MKESFIHETARVDHSQTGLIKIFRNAAISNSTIGDGCSIGDDTTVERCIFENGVVVNRRSYINDSVVGRYTYMGINTTMNFTHIGKFCSLGRNVDIGGFDHDYHKVTTMPLFRYNQLKNGGGKIPQITKHEKYCEIGNDVWIAAGAQVLHKVKVGNGAVIGGGAVITKDVPPYAIVVGVPARVIGYRCSEKHVADLEKLKWWDWPESIIDSVMDELASKDISDDTIEFLYGIYNSIILKGAYMDMKAEEP